MLLASLISPVFLYQTLLRNSDESLDGDVKYRQRNNGIIRKLWCAFLLAIHSNYGALRVTYWSKFAKYLYSNCI